jgi:hypothetical protein
MGDRRGAYTVLVGRPERKRPFERPGPRWYNNIKMDLQDVRWRSTDYINLAQDREKW